MDIRFDGKRALVTGGGRGIGREIAQSLVKCGAKVFVLTKSDSSVENIRQEDPEINVVQVDLVDWEGTRKAVESVLPINLLVNNAGIIRGAPFFDFTESDVDELFATHYKATFNISQIVAQDMVRRKEPGSIVNVSSVLSRKCIPSFSVYGSCKAAVDTLTRYLAQELGPETIRVNSINLTCVPTDMVAHVLENTVVRDRVIADIPLHRLGEKREAADAVLYLLSDHASLVNGVNMAVDGGHLV